MKKRILCLFLVLLMCMSNMEIAVNADDKDESLQVLTTTSSLKGDVDGNNVVDNDDLIILSKHIAKISYISQDSLLLNADVNSDGKVNSEDLTELSIMVYLNDDLRIIDATVNNETANVGSKFEWNALALGGNGQIEYAFELKKINDNTKYTDETVIESQNYGIGNNDETFAVSRDYGSESSNETAIISQNYSTNSKFSVTIDEAGIYALTIKCKDESDTVCSLRNVLPITVINTTFDSIYFDTSTEKYCCELEPLKWSVKQVGGNAPFSYQYTLFFNGSEIDSKQSDNAEYIIESCLQGVYQLMVKCTDVNGISKSAVSEQIDVYSIDEYYPEAPEVRTAGDTFKLATIIADAQKTEACSIILEWNAVAHVYEYGLELAYYAAGEWNNVHTAEAIRAKSYILPQMLFKYTAVERMYRLGVYSKGISNGNIRYYYFILKPTVVDNSLTVNGSDSVTWDIAVSHKSTNSFNVSSVLDWTVISNVEWITCVKGTDKFTVNVAENFEHTDSRSGIITVDNGINSAFVYVNQGNGDGAPLLEYPLFSDIPDNPTISPVGGINVQFSEDDANYVGVRIYELENNGKTIPIYENVVARNTKNIRITNEDTGNRFVSGKSYAIELAGHYSAAYVQNEVEYDVEKSVYYFDMVSAGHDILINGTNHWKCEDYEKTSILLYSTNTWTYSSDAEWLHVENYNNVTYSKDIHNIDIIFDPNYTENPRSGTVTFYCGDKSAFISVTQDSWLPRFLYPELSQDMNNPTILPSCGVMEGAVCKESTYATYKNGTWSNEITNLKSNNNVDCFYDIIPDNYFESNVLYRFTMHTGDKSKVYYAKFNSNSVQKYIALNNNLSDVKEITYHSSSAETEYDLEMIANSAWTITSDSSWLTPSSNSGTSFTPDIVVSIKENTTGYERTGVLSFKIGSTVYATFKVVQDAYDYLTLFEHSYDYIRYNSNTSFKSCYDEVSLYALCNGEWGASSNNSWIKIKNKSSIEGIASGKNIRLDLEENNTGLIRTGTVTVHSGKVSEIIEITQVPWMEDPVLVSPTLSTSYKNPSALIYNDINLRWNAVNCAEYYKVCVKPADTSILLPGSFYYSFVNKINNTGSGTYSCVIPKGAFSLNADSYDTIYLYAYDKYGISVLESYYLISSLNDYVRINGTMSPSWNDATDIEVSKEFTVNSTSNWTAESMTSWITIDRQSGSDGDVLKVNLSKNTGNARTGTVVVKVSNTETILTVNQCAYLPEYPGITFPELSDDFGSPTVIPADTTSVKVKWNSAAQAEYYRIELLSYVSDTVTHTEMRSPSFKNRESEWEFTDLNLTPGQIYIIEILCSSHWGYTGHRYYFSPAVDNAYVRINESNSADLEFDSTQGCERIKIESSNVWTASVSDYWIMLGKTYINQEILDEEGYTSVDFKNYSGVSNSNMYISVLANPGNEYRYGTVTVRSGGAEAVINVTQEPYYETAKIYMPVLAENRQDSVGLSRGDIVLNWNECVGGSGTYQIILEKRVDGSEYKYSDILNVMGLRGTSYTIKAIKLQEGGYYCVNLYSNIPGVDKNESPCQSYYFYVKYDNELSVTADINWQASSANMVAITSNASGGAGGYKFAFQLFLDGEKIAASDFDDMNYYTFMLTETGTYHVRVYCEDTFGNSTEFISSNYDYGSTDTASVTLSQSTWNVASSGESISVNVSSDSDWAIESYPSWITCSALSGTNGDVVVFTAENNTLSARTGNVVFVSGSARATFTIEQESAVLNPSIIYPIAGIAIDLSNITVKWTRVAQANSYLFSMRDITTDIPLEQHVNVDDNTTYTIPMHNLIIGHEYRIAVGASVNGQIWWKESTFKINALDANTDIDDEGVPVVHDYKRVIVDTVLINQNESFHDIVTTYYEKCSICSDESARKTETITVAHDYSYTGYEKSHPHALFKRCTCGAVTLINNKYKTANGQVQEYDNCCICHGHSYNIANPQEVDGQWRAYCTKCGNYKTVNAPSGNPTVICNHPEGFNMQRTIPNVHSCTNLNEKYYHLEYNSSYSVFCCRICGKANMATKSLIIENKHQPHMFDSNAVCTLCGYASTCGIYDYTDRYVLSIDSKYYLKDYTYIGIMQNVRIWVYDRETKSYVSASDISDLTLSLNDPDGIAKIEGDTIIASTCGNFEVVLSYFGKQVDTHKIGATVLTMKDSWGYKIISSGTVLLEDMDKLDWWDGNLLLMPWVAMGNYSSKKLDDSYSISFEVYNRSAETYGVVAYNDRGEKASDTILIKPHWETGSFVEGAWETFSKTTQIWNSKSFDGTGTETTKITIQVPEGGYISFIDMSKDIKILASNIGEVIIGTLKVKDDFEGLINPADIKTMQKLIDSLGEDEFVDVICEYLQKEYSNDLKQFFIEQIEDSVDKWSTETMVQLLLQGGLMDEIIASIPVATLKILFDKVEDFSSLLICPGLYYVKKSSQALYDIGGMAQLSAAFERCIFNNTDNNKYVEYVSIPHKSMRIYN